MENLKRLVSTPQGEQLIDLTSEEIAQRKAEEDAWKAGAFDRAIAGLRQRRNALLSATDYLALSDNTLSVAMSEYRQSLRDITEGVNTVAKVNAVVFPDRP
jgi:endonuclease/exonuclease/phosphatase family metal-dependent hydrolase